MLFSQLAKANCENKQIQNNVITYILSSVNVSNDKNISVLGEEIKKARKNRGFTLKELGGRVNLTHSALSQIENNVNEPSKKTLIALAKELGDTFGLDWLNEHLAESDAAPSKKEIIENASVEEIFTLKFGNEKNKRTRDQLIKLRKLAEQKLEDMLDLDE